MRAPVERRIPSIFGSVIGAGECIKEIASPVMNFTRHRLLTFSCRNLMQASASAHPDVLLTYPQSPTLPPVPIRFSISFLSLSS